MKQRVTIDIGASSLMVVHEGVMTEVISYSITDHRSGLTFTQHYPIADATEVCLIACLRWVEEMKKEMSSRGMTYDIPLHIEVDPRSNNMLRDRLNTLKGGKP